MSGRELVKKVFKLGYTDHIPWVPFVSCHGGKPINKTATQYLQSTEYIIEGVSKAIEIYKPDGIPVVFDLQIEAEGLGCQLAWADDNPPAVVSHVLTEGKEISQLKVPDKNTGRIPIVLKAALELRKQHKNIPMDYVKEIALKHNISFGGNIQPTVVFLMGTPEESQPNALECMDLGGNKDFILAPGCDLTMNTPFENIKAVTELVQDPYQQEVLRAKEKNDTELDLLNMKDYGSSAKVIADIITLDSESCAPCQYMVEAVKKVAPQC